MMQLYIPKTGAQLNSDIVILAIILAEYINRFFMLRIKPSYLTGGIRITYFGMKGHDCRS